MTDNKMHLLYIISVYTVCVHIMQSLIVYFSLLIKSKPNDGIALPAIILGVSVFMNKHANKKTFCDTLKK